MGLDKLAVFFSRAILLIASSYQGKSQQTKTLTNSRVQATVLGLNFGAVRQIKSFLFDC